MYWEGGTVSSMLVGESTEPRGSSTDVPPSETVPPRSPMVPEVV
jgi:hypothetical protein